MANTPSSTDTTSPKRRGSLLRKLGIACGVLLALLVVTYFVVTSGAFFKGVILPKVGAAMNSEVTVAEASLSPFSQVILQDLKVQPKGAEPLFTAKEVRLRYSLMSILGGTIAVQEVFVDSPAVTLVQNADGTSNLDPITQASSGSGPAPAPTSGAAKPLVLDIQNVTVKNASVKQTTKFKGGGEQVVEVGAGSFSLANLKNGQSAKLELGADVGFRTSQPTNATLGARLDGKFTLAVGNDGLPQTVSGGARLAINQASGLLADLAQSAAVLDCDMSPTDIKGIVLKLQRASTDLAALRLAGPFDAAKREGKLTLEAFGIDRNLLNLAGRGAGLDFGTTVFASTNRLELANGGQSLALNGQVLGSKLSVTQAGATTPALEVSASYDLSVDQAKEIALVRTFDLRALRGANRLVEGSLSKPMRIEWARGANAVDESEFKLSLNGLDLREYRAFLGTNVVGGTINGVLGIESKAAGRQLALTLTANGADIATAMGANTISALGFALKSAITIQDFEKLQIQEGDLRLTHRGQEALHAQATGQVMLTNQTADLVLAAEAPLPVLAGLSPVPGSALTSGRLTLGAKVKQDAASAQSLDGSLLVTNLSGTFGEYRFDAWGAKADFDLGLKDKLAVVRKLAGSLQQAGQPAGAFDVKLESHLTTLASKLTLKLTDLNQRALAPFVNPALGGKSLQSIAISANLDGGYDPKADSTLRGEAKVANLVVAGDGLPAKPLEAGFTLDVALRKQTADIRDCTLKLTPTARGKNELTLKGNLDFSNTNALSGTLKLVADTLDFTPYYDLFMAAPGAPAKPAPSTAAAKPGADPNLEPPASVMPVSNFVAEASINRLHLRDLEVASFQTTVKLDGGKTLVKPFKASLNGAPVNGSVELDLGVPGYKYDVNFGADNVPIPPLVSLAMPDRTGQFGGTATATLGLKGAGITEANLAKNLSGNFYLGTTNLNFKLVDARSSLVKSVVNIVIGIPDMLRSVPALLKDPVAGAGAIFGKLTGAATSSAPGWVDQIMQSPADVIVLRGQVGSSRLEVQEARLRSPAFLAEARGEIGLLPVLTNSTLKLPLQISLARGLAEKVKLVPAGTPSNAVYAKLPDFVGLKGTVGNPKTDLNAIALAGLAAQAGAGLAGDSGGALGSALGSVGSLLTGGSGTKSGGSNAPASSGSGLSNVLGGLFPQPSNNAPASGTNAAPAPNKNNTVRNILGGLLGGGAKPATNAPAAGSNAPAGGR
jgi:hypothetical protein